MIQNPIQITVHFGVHWQIEIGANGWLIGSTATLFIR